MVTYNFKAATLTQNHIFLRNNHIIEYNLAVTKIAID